MRYYKYLIFITLFIHVQSTPLFENQIATFIRDFILSGATMDQDDEPFDLGIDETLTKDVEEVDSVLVVEPNDKGKKVLVFYKDDEDEDEFNKVIKRRGKRTTDSLKKTKPKKKMSRQQAQRIFTELRRNLSGRPINMRTILEALEQIEGGNEIGEMLSNSVLSAIREFFTQLMSSFVV